MYQVVQKKFNLCAVVVYNCFISPVDAVLCKVFFFFSSGPVLHLASLRADIPFVKCVYRISTFYVFINILKQSQRVFNKMFHQSSSEDDRNLIS